MKMNLTLILASLIFSFKNASAFNNARQLRHPSKSSCSSSSLMAIPKRLEENVEGVVYVNEKCINCATCSNFAPSVFRRANVDDAHIVYHQPKTAGEISDARAAMLACPVAAIRSETLMLRRNRDDNKEGVVKDSWTESDGHLAQQMTLNPKINGLDLPFPRPLLYHDAAVTTTGERPNFMSNVYNVGHHNENSFGATPYLVKAKVDDKSVWIMVDSPRFERSAMDAVTKITGPDGPRYLFLTHVDDTAGHEKWAEEFPKMKRIFHLGDGGSHNWLGDRSLETDVEILLNPPEGSSPPKDSTGSPFHAYNINGTPLPNDWYQDFLQDDLNDVVILHTPGHSPGSITLWKKPSSTERGVIFTGDHYAYSTRTSQMSGFPRFGHDINLQSISLERLLEVEWDIVAPGHGHPRDYSGETEKENLKQQEMKEALQNLFR